MRSFPVPVLSFLFVSFRPSLLRSHSCSTGACLPLSLPTFSVPLPLSFVRFRFPSGYSAFCSSVPMLPLPASQGPFRCFLRFFRRSGFPFPFRPVSRAYISLPGTWLSVCFLSSFPASLPRLFRWCSPSVSLRCLSIASLSFVRSALGFDYSASALSFPFIPASPRSGSFRCRFIRFPFACFHAPLPLWYSASCSSFLLLLRFASQVAFRKMRLFLSALAASP